ncbi:hypothetical protein IV203_005756 [Nitzschia inconspicua]|uniref:J domain-containing protein n=1 Tax=Nitzschia inconspicua TaxID=303405 RepID=A0A9K3KN80_9STRA|nr:hypothetical protein IV203_005756 [Nitzschia inconspicua]
MSNGYGHHQQQRSVLVLYRIINSDSDGADPHYNCFSMPYGSGITLNAVKQNCTATHTLSHLGPEGYHWRVMVEDKPGSAGSERSFSWWDIQDGNAKLPIKETSQSDLRKLLFPTKAASSSTTDTATKAAKGAFKMMGKAVASAIGEDSMVENSGPPVSVLVVKLLDLVKLHDEFALKHGGGGGGHAPTPAPRPRRAPAATRPPPQQRQQSRQPHPRPVASAGHGHAPPQQHRAQNSGVTSSAPPRAPANLMDFGDAPAPAPVANSGGGFNPKVLHHSHSSPASAVNPNETRAERLKREQEARMKQKNRVWDDVDQRWVEVHPDEEAKGNGSFGAVFGSSASAPQKPPKKEVGIKLDMSNAVGKSATVQKAISERVNEMEANRQKAVAEVKQREALKKQREEEEDRIRQQLEPKIKAWSEEHGKKKQLTALLGSLHTILWPGAKWKQVSIGDVLDPKKCKKIYFKATLVVHPDKTHDLPADQRFLAKRIFDALTQAKTIYDQNGGR